MAQDGKSAPRSGKILVIEDDSSQARLVTFWLKSAGYDAHAASNGNAGLKMLEEGTWDMVLSDVDMPGASGLAILQESKRRFPNTPAMLMTAHPAVQMASLAIERGVDGYLLKPLSKESLIKRVNEVIDRYREIKSDIPTVLAIGAKPDEIELGCGGSLAAHKTAGHRIILLNLSWGGSPAMRRREAQDAADILGATLVPGNLRDGAMEHREVIQVIERVIEQYRPDVMYIPTDKTMDQDQGMVHRAAVVASRSVPRVYCYQGAASTIAFQPHRFVGIDPHVETKLTLIGAHSSQVGRRELDPDVVRSNAIYWSRFSEHRFVEALEVMRESAEGVGSGKSPV